VWCRGEEKDDTRGKYYVIFSSIIVAAAAVSCDGDTMVAE
jgi:hypothetical protein